MSTRKKFALDVSLYMRLLHRENKISVFVIRKKYQKQKIVQLAACPITFVTGIGITKKHF